MVARRSQDRSTIARIAALTRHAHTNGREATEAARSTFEARFEREVDPEGVLAPAERQRRAELARRAYFAKLSRRGVEARRAKQPSARNKAG